MPSVSVNWSLPTESTVPRATVTVTKPLLVSTTKLPATVRADQPQQFWLWAYLSNWVQPFDMTAAHTFPHFWSLAVEEQFYLLWPLLTWRRSPQTVLRCGLALALLSPVVRAGVLLGGGTSDMVYLWTPCRMDALALGGSVAAALRMPGLVPRLMAHRRRWLAAAAAVFIVCVAGFRGLSHITFALQTLGYSLLAISFSSLVLALVCCDLAGDAQWGTRLWHTAPLRVLARYSYGIYIIHMPLKQAISGPLTRLLGADMQHSTWANFAYFGVGMAGSLALAVLSYHLFEQRFLALKARVR